MKFSHLTSFSSKTPVPSNTFTNIHHLWRVQAKRWVVCVWHNGERGAKEFSSQVYWRISCEIEITRHQFWINLDEIIDIEKFSKHAFANPIVSFFSTCMCLCFNVSFPSTNLNSSNHQIIASPFKFIVIFILFTFSLHFFLYNINLQLYIYVFFCI